MHRMMMMMTRKWPIMWCVRRHVELYSVAHLSGGPCRARTAGPKVRWRVWFNIGDLRCDATASSNGWHMCSSGTDNGGCCKKTQKKPRIMPANRTTTQTNPKAWKQLVQRHGIFQYYWQEIIITVTGYTNTTDITTITYKSSRNNVKCSRVDVHSRQRQLSQDQRNHA